ncbi:MAG: hypothetical protein L6437_03270 [Kiritimatiellae bacterium]|nr:hypothetical protein [Kiritimatiellia bacterium]
MHSRTYTSTLKIIPTDQWKAWRKNITDAGGTVAVVTGTFALWHPGNLAAIQEAARQASHVCVIIHPASPALAPRSAIALRDGESAKPTAEPGSPVVYQGAAMPSVAVRLEMAANLRAVSLVATCSPGDAEAAFARLRPFTLVDCIMQKTPGTIATVARKLADHIVDLAPVAGCFTADIQKAIQDGRTPVAVPDAVMAPQPDRHDLGRFLDTGAPGRPACNAMRPPAALRAATRLQRYAQHCGQVWAGSTAGRLFPYLQLPVIVWRPIFIVALVVLLIISASLAWEWSHRGLPSTTDACRWLAEPPAPYLTMEERPASPSR